MDRGKMMHSKTEIATRLDAIASTRLFGDGKWLVDREVATGLNEAIGAMGLQEQLSENTSRDTVLGKEVNLSLYMVFMGLWEPWEMVHILEEHGCLTRMKSIPYSICWNEAKSITSQRSKLACNRPIAITIDRHSSTEEDDVLWN
jgi:hypothetical protein